MMSLQWFCSNKTRLCVILEGQDIKTLVVYHGGLVVFLSQDASECIFTIKSQPHGTITTSSAVQDLPSSIISRTTGLDYGLFLKCVSCKCSRGPSIWLSGLILTQSVLCMQTISCQGKCKRGLTRLKLFQAQVCFF